MANIATNIRRGLRKEFDEWDFCGWAENDEEIYWLCWHADMTSVLTEGVSDTPTKHFVGLRFTNRAHIQRLDLINIATREQVTYTFDKLDITQRKDELILKFISREDKSDVELVMSDIIYSGD